MVTEDDDGRRMIEVLDGSAWMIAARDACTTWTDSCEHAWRQAWLLLSDVLSNESLSPFAGPSSE